jgi:DNA-binding NarL/FixJ family response regulator
MASFSSEGKARILVLDDHPLVREGLSLIINRESDLVASAHAGSAELLHSTVSSFKPDLVTIDLGLQNGNGLDVIKTLQLNHPLAPTLVISQYDEMIYAERALKAGARGYVMMDQATDKVLAAIRTVLAGDLYFSPRVAALALRRFGQSRSETKHHNGGIGILSNRELQILELLGAGLGTRVIAEKLGLSVKTIEAHREHIKHKLGLSSASLLLGYAANWLKEQSHRHSPEAVSSRVETGPVV